jgi:DNA-binding IclR family transcriptional regulator
VLDRSVTLLELLADGPRSLRWLSDHSRLPRPTAHRLLVALEAHGLVGRDGSGAFRLGPRLAELAFRANPTLDLATLADPVLARLHDATGESVQLYVRRGAQRLCVASLESPHSLRTIVPVGAALPLDRGSAGKVLRGLADGGWAESVEEREPGVASVSAAVRDHRLGADGTIVAAVSVSGPVERTTRQPGERYGDLVVAAAAALERAAGLRNG